MYPHRDKQDAAEAVALIARKVPLQKIRVLDLACGPGRHAELLRKGEAEVVGLDLSMPLLRRARENFSPPMVLARGDMRSLPFAASSFELVVNLFTSFGYFDTDEEHQLVVGEVARILTKGGTFVLDFLNASIVRDCLVQHEERNLGGRQVAIDRRISNDGRFVFKEIHLLEDDNRFVERVRLFSDAELEHLLGEKGFIIEERYGDYTGGSLTSGSPRVLLFSRLA